MIRILSLPARHPYTSKFHLSSEIKFVNPDTDYFNNYGGQATPGFIEKTHPKNTYDIVHIHFSFDKLSIEKLSNLLDYFDEIKKPIVWTCHSRESQREKDIGNGELQKMLYNRSKLIITPTEGCKTWIINTYGKNKKVEVIPLGYMVNPDTLTLYKQNLKKKSKNNFIFLIGDMRKNKEVNQTIINFLQCSEFKKCTLTVIIKPLSIYENSFEKFDKRIVNFWNIIQPSKRINIVSLPEISNELLIKLFCESHACLLPYLWGTHSGQVELSKDCGCYPVISNVGFYNEQSDQIIEFKYNEKPATFAYNFTQALIKAHKMPLLTPHPKLRRAEFIKITQRHIDIYKNILKS